MFLYRLTAACSRVAPGEHAFLFENTDIQKIQIDFRYFTDENCFQIVKSFESSGG